MNQKIKKFKSKDYNYVFDKKTGFFARWGESKDKDPQYSPFGPETLNIEISSQEKNMSLETFRKVLSIFPKVLTQVVLQVESVDSNPDLWKIMDHIRGEEYIPNLDVGEAEIKEEHYSSLATRCGAVGVLNRKRDQCYSTIKKLTEAMRGTENVTLQQVNIHQPLSEDTLEDCFDLLVDFQSEERLEHLNAVIFLLLESKNTLNRLEDSTRFRDLVKYSLDNNINIGFDSCSVPLFLEIVKDRPDFKHLEQSVESCESACFSMYVDAHGISWPCSFAKSKRGINILKVENFSKGVWLNENIVNFRKKLENSYLETGYRECPFL